MLQAVRNGSKVDNKLMRSGGGGAEVEVSSIEDHCCNQGGSLGGTAPGAGGCVMASTAGPLGGPRSCSAPLLAALSHYCVCLGKISNVKALQRPEHAVKGDAAERTAGKRDRD